MEGKTLLTRTVNRDGSADFKRKERYKQKLESVGLTTSDDLFMRGDGRRFGDAMSLWQRIEYGNIFGYFIDRPGTGSLQLVSIGLCEDCVCGVFRPRQPKVQNRPTKRGLGPIARSSGLIVAD